jgi:nitrite reductase/ring-hydroxylating ferredoxin subunit
MTAAVTHHAVGAVEEFVDGNFKIFEIDDRSVGVVKSGDTFFAVLNVCPHARAPICEGIVTGAILPCAPGDEPAFGLNGRVLCCPWHHYEFDLGNGGRGVFTDFRGRVRVFPVHVQDGKVFVEMNDSARRQKRQAGVARDPGGGDEDGGRAPIRRRPATTGTSEVSHDAQRIDDRL